MTYRIPSPPADSWPLLLDASRSSEPASRRDLLRTLDPDDELTRLYAPLLEADGTDRPYVLGHLAQSLDGCIALPAGESQWISGHDDLVHTHRLRALCDAVLVGAQTVLDDDPQLTVRHVDGPNPLRVVLDPRGRVPADRKVFTTPVPTLLVTGAPRPDLTERDTLELLPCDDETPLLGAVLAALHDRGVRRVLVEGGGITVSRFLEAGVLDRLHLVMAPLLVGEGRPSLSGTLGVNLASCPRPRTQVVPLGQDWLFDCAFT